VAPPQSRIQHSSSASLPLAPSQRTLFQRRPPPRGLWVFLEETPRYCAPAVQPAQRHQTVRLAVSWLFCASELTGIEIFMCRSDALRAQIDHKNCDCTFDEVRFTGNLKFSSQNCLMRLFCVFLCG